MKISYLLPIRISDQNNQLKIAVDEISDLIRKKQIEFESEESSVEFVELDNDQFEHQTEYIEDNRDVLNGITQTLYSSLFVSIYSHLETNLSSLIKEVESRTNHKIKSKHLKRDGSFIKCCLTYLELVQGLDLTVFSDKIKYLNDITLIRNVFTHSRGILPKETSKTKTAVYRFVKENEGIEIENSLIVITDKEFIEKVIINSNDFLLKLINIVNEN